ncbi:hypothetical protein BJ912DRAFT_1069604 [Pholiota molesta]|nr:hypothetical protein BJ912DRAFT_1069604 [Pholiota molesta]
MARVPHTNPDGVKSIDDLVATLLLMGIDVNNARTRANVLAAAAAAANGTGPTISEDAASGETATTEAIPAPAPNIGNNTSDTGDHESEADTLATSAGDTEATQAGSARATSATLDWADDWEEDDDPPRRSALQWHPSSAAAPAAPAVATGASGGSATLSGNGFHCAFCQQFNTVRPSEAFYVVTIGLQVGVFTHWHIVQPLVSGVSGACYRRYSSQAAAQAAFDEALAAGLVMVVTPSPVTLPHPGCGGRQ